MSHSPGSGAPGPDHLRGVLIVTAAVVVISFDALLIRLADTSGWNVAFWRGGLMALSLGLVTLARGGSAAARFRRLGVLGAFSALLYGVSGLLFVLSVTHTAVANTVVIVSTAPLFAAIFTRAFLAEPVRRRTWVAIALVCVGVAVVSAGSLGSALLLGDLYALLAAVTLGANLTLLRRHHALPRVPLVCLSGAFTAVLALPLAEPWGLPWPSYAALGVMGLVQMPTAMVLLSVGTRHLPAPEVSLFLLVETVLGPVWVWAGVGERPPVVTFLGGAIIVLTLGGNAWLGLREARRARAPFSAVRPRPLQTSHRIMR